MISRTLCFGIGQAKEAKDGIFLFLASPVDTVDCFGDVRKASSPLGLIMGTVNVYDFAYFEGFVTHPGNT